MLGFSGRAIDNLHVPGLLQNAAEPLPRGFWYRWSRTVQRHPIMAGGAALLCLLVLIIPFFSMRLAFTDAGNDPPTPPPARPSTPWPPDSARASTDR
jgi:RND superfamily putative drug exporter